MPTIGAAVFAGHDPSGLPGIHPGLGKALRTGAALAFALLARRLLTMAPAFAILATGLDPIRALILSQVALSFGIPFALAPLIALTSRRALMGDLVNRRPALAAGAAVTALITALNSFLVIQTCTD
jgi:manganese transport protein